MCYPANFLSQLEVHLRCPLISWYCCCSVRSFPSLIVRSPSSFPLSTSTELQPCLSISFTVFPPKMGETEAYSKERSPSAEEGIKVTEYRDPDEAINAFEGLDSPLVLDEATNKRLLRKIDMMLMPVRFNSDRLSHYAIPCTAQLMLFEKLQMLCIVYCLNFLDSEWILHQLCIDLIC